MSDKLRVAVIGCGGIARDIYLPLLDASDEATISACVDPSEDARGSLCARYPAAGVIPDTVELNPDDCDCALLLSPVREGLDTHYEPALTLMEAGVPTLCEKPFSARLARAEEMVEASGASDTLLMMSVNRRFAPVYHRAFEHFEGHTIEVCIAEKSGTGGIFREIVTNSLHTLDAMRWLCGEVEQVQGWCVSDGETDLRASVSMSFEAGGLGSFVMSRQAGRWIERMVLHGEGRSAIVDAPREVELVTSEGRVRWSPDQCCWQLCEAERWGFGAQLRHFFACVRGDEQPHATALDALESQRLADMIRKL